MKSVTEQVKPVKQINNIGFNDIVKRAETRLNRINDLLSGNGKLTFKVDLPNEQEVEGHKTNKVLLEITSDKIRTDLKELGIDFENLTEQAQNLENKEITAFTKSVLTSKLRKYAKMLYGY